MKDAEYIWELLPIWIKTMEKGLCPTMYGTGSYENDLKVHEKCKNILFPENNTPKD